MGWLRVVCVVDCWVFVVACSLYCLSAGIGVSLFSLWRGGCCCLGFSVVSIATCLLYCGVDVYCVSWSFCF